MWKYYAVASAVFAALTAILAKAGVRRIDSNVATAIRTTVVLVLTWGIVLAGGSFGRVREVGWSSLWFLILSGAATGLSWLCYFRALQLGPVSKVAPIDKLSVALAMLLAFLIFHEPMEAKTLLGGALIVGGSLVLLL